MAELILKSVFYENQATRCALKLVSLKKTFVDVVRSQFLHRPTRNKLAIWMPNQLQPTTPSLKKNNVHCTNKKANKPDPTLESIITQKNQISLYPIISTP